MTRTYWWLYVLLGLLLMAPASLASPYAVMRVFWFGSSLALTLHGAWYGRGLRTALLAVPAAGVAVFVLMNAWGTQGMAVSAKLLVVACIVVGIVLPFVKLLELEADGVQPVQITIPSLHITLPDIALPRREAAIADDVVFEEPPRPQRQQRSPAPEPVSTIDMTNPVFQRTAPAPVPELDIDRIVNDVLKGIERAL